MADSYQNHHQTHQWSFTPSISRQMSVESDLERQSSEYDESVSFIEAAISDIHFEPGDVVLCGDEQGIVVSSLSRSEKIRVSHNDGRIECVYPSELLLVQKVEDLEAPVPKVPIEFDDLGCVLCHDILCEPLSLPCGHTFCRLCITMTVQRTSKKCPTCRAICHISPLTQPENVVVSKLCKKTFPEQYERKRRETKAQMERVSRSHPVLFHNSVQFPSSTMPLCLFETYSKVMIRRCISADQKFVYLSDSQGYQAQCGQIGFLCRVSQYETDMQDQEFSNGGKLLFFDHVVIEFQRRIIVTNAWTDEGTQQNLQFVDYDFYDDDEGVAIDEESKDAFITGAWADLRVLFSFMQNQEEENTLGQPPQIENLDKCIWWCSQFLVAMRQISKDKVDKLLLTKSLQERLNIINEIRSPERGERPRNSPSPRDSQIDEH